MTMTSKDAFAAAEKQARTTLTHYIRYRLGPQLQAYAAMAPEKMVIMVGCIVASVAYAFTVQAEVYVGMAIMHNILGKEGWRAGVLAIIGAGLICSFLLSEVIPYTRLLTQTTKIAAPERMETLVGQVLGMRRPNPNQQNRLIAVTISFIAIMLLLIIYFAIQGNVQTDLGPAVVLAPMLFCLDVLCGIGPFWLLVFAINLGSTFLRNRQAQTNYNRLEAAWNLVPELYSGAQDWYFQEHPEINRRPEMLPPVSPLCAFIITHPCHEGIEIPAAIINPEGNTGGDTGAAPVPEEAPDVTPRNPSSGNGSPKAEPSKKVDEKEVTKAPEKDEALDNPADLFAAMDSDSDANDVTF